MNSSILSLSGPQPMQLVFDTSMEDKIETPGELPDPEKGGLGGARPLGMSASSSSLSSQIHPPPPPTAPPPPPPPPSHAKKSSSSLGHPPQPKLDQEVSTTRIFDSRNSRITTSLSKSGGDGCSMVLHRRYILMYKYYFLITSSSLLSLILLVFFLFCK